jgi:hypothetical protein
MRFPALAAFALLISAPMVHGVITALLPLRDVVQAANYVCVAKVDQFLPDKPAMVLTVQEDLRGKNPFRKMPVVLQGDDEAKKLNHVPQLLKRLGPDLPLILFVTDNNTDNKQQLLALTYTNGTWMQLVGKRTGDGTAVWSLTHGEPYLRRTFSGTTAELRQVLVDALAGKKRLPDINKAESPGFGPEVSK